MPRQKRAKSGTGIYQVKQVPVPCVFKVEYFLKIDVNGLNVIQNNSYNFFIPGNNPLNLHGRIIDGGISLFKIKF